MMSREVEIEKLRRAEMVLYKKQSETTDKKMETKPLLESNSSTAFVGGDNKQKTPSELKIIFILLVILQFLIN